MVTTEGVRAHVILADVMVPGLDEVELLTARLRESEQRYRQLMEALPVALYTTDGDGRITAFNRSAVALWGREPEIGELWCGSHRMYREDGSELPLDRCPMAVAVQEIRSTQGAEAVIERPDGTRRDVLAHPQILRNSAGRFTGALNVLVDITERKRTEAELAATLRNSERLYRAIGESIDYGVWVCDPTGRNLYASESFLRLVGLTQEQCSNFGWGEVLHPDDIERTLAAWKECVDKGGEWDVEHRFRGVDGNWHPILARGMPVRNERGEITAWAGINLDISRLKHVEDELRLANRRKDEFLATLAHELRNPLAPIVNSLQIMKLDANSAESMAQARGIIERQVQQMVRLIDDLLDVSRISRGSVHLRKERVDLATIVQSAVETSRPLIDAGNHRITVSLPTEPIPVNVDVTRMAQVFANLLNNAAKYTPPGGHLRLVVEPHGETVTIAVQDDGLGIPAPMLSQVFEMFAQVDQSLERRQGGLGIGLTIARRLVEMHDGRIEVHSDGHGLGSEFVVTLPRLAASAGVSTAGGERPAGAGAPKRRILVVDDNEGSSFTLATMLRLMGNETRMAADGLEAIEVAQEFRPEVIFLDIGMPGLNGYDTCIRIREQPWGKEMILIALTGWGQEEDIRRSMEAGFDHHLVKPVEMSVLRTVLR